MSGQDSHLDFVQLGAGRNSTYNVFGQGGGFVSAGVGVLFPTRARKESRGVLPRTSLPWFAGIGTVEFLKILPAGSSSQWVGTPGYYCRFIRSAGF